MLALPKSKHNICNMSSFTYVINLEGLSTSKIVFECVEIREDPKTGDYGYPWRSQLGTCWDGIAHCAVYSISGPTNHALDWSLQHWNVWYEFGRIPARPFLSNLMSLPGPPAGLFPNDSLQELSAVAG